jgi:hypothetical protein
VLPLQLLLLACTDTLRACAAEKGSVLNFKFNFTLPKSKQ